MAFLKEAYFHVKQTVPLLMACGSRLDDDKEWLRGAVAHYIDDEYGHEKWILNDIRACGGDDLAAVEIPDLDLGGLGGRVDAGDEGHLRRLDPASPPAHLPR